MQVFHEIGQAIIETYSSLTKACTKYSKHPAYFGTDTEHALERRSIVVELTLVYVPCLNTEHLWFGVRVSWDRLCFSYTNIKTYHAFNM